jgi:hypothetical protein
MMRRDARLGNDEPLDTVEPVEVAQEHNVRRSTRIARLD